MAFIPTQFEFDFEQMHIDSKYHMIIRKYLDDLKCLLESSLSEFVDVNHATSMIVDNRIESILNGYESANRDIITYTTFDKSVEISLEIRDDKIVVDKFESKDITYVTIDDFLNKFIYRVSRLYDIKKVICYDIKNLLLSEWFEKNGGSVNEREYKDGEASVSMVFHGKKEIDGELLINSVFIQEEYDINCRRDTFVYVTKRAGYIIKSLVEKHIKQNIKVKIDNDYDSMNECNDEYVGGISFRSYSGEVLYLEFFVDEVSIVVSDRIDDANVFLDNNISEIIKFAKYFVDVDNIYVRSEVNNDIIYWCEGSGFNKIDEEPDRCAYKFILSKYEEIEKERKHPYKTCLASIISSGCDVELIVGAVGSQLEYDLEDLNNNQWISAMENNRYNSKYENYCRELKYTSNWDKMCTYDITIKDELNGVIVSENIKIIDSKSNMTIYLDFGVDFIIIRPHKEAKSLFIFNKDKELLLSLLLTGDDWTDIVYDVRNNKYVSDNKNVKEMVCK